MAVTQLTTEPLKLTAGDTVSFSKSLADYRASLGWSLKYELRGGAQPIEWLSSAQADAHIVLVPASTTKTYLPGTYSITGFAVNAGTGERQQIYFNLIPVSANAETQPGDADTLTFNQKMLAKWQAVLLGTAGHDILQSDVDGTRIGRLSLEEKIRYHDYWLAKVNNEMHAARVNAGGESQRTVKIIFTRPK